MNSTAEKTGRQPRFSWLSPDFVLLPENRSAVFAVRRLARILPAQRCAFVPLVLYGPPGSGKSHLAAALRDLAKSSHSTCRVEANAWPYLDDHAALLELRSCDLAVIEDLQHLPKWATNSLATILDRRRSRGLATLITANRGPAELPRLPSRLLDRLTAGLMVKIELPNAASRRRLLANLLAKRGITARNEVLDWLAVNTPGSGRQLLAAAERLATLTAASPHPPDLDAVQSVFQPDIRRPTLEKIVRLASARFGVDVRQLRGLDRHPSIVWPRQLCMHLARRSMRLSLARIGQYFGRDHSTVRHACEKVENELRRDAGLRGVFREMAAEI